MAHTSTWADSCSSPGVSMDRWSCMYGSIACAAVYVAAESVAYTHSIAILDAGKGSISRQIPRKSSSLPSCPSHALEISAEIRYRWSLLIASPHRHTTFSHYSHHTLFSFAFFPRILIRSSPSRVSPRTGSSRRTDPSALHGVSTVGENTGGNMCWGRE